LYQRELILSSNLWNISRINYLDINYQISQLRTNTSNLILEMFLYSRFTIPSQNSEIAKKMEIWRHLNMKCSISTNMNCWETTTLKILTSPNWHSQLKTKTAKKKKGRINKTKTQNRCWCYVLFWNREK